MTTLLISAGDASGDLHAADFVRAFRAKVPDARIVGMGGDALRAADVELVVHQRELAVGGLLELVGSAFRIAKVWRAMKRALIRERPDLVVLVDSGGFNIPFAKQVRRHCAAKVFYFVAPQVWAWRPNRVKKIAARVDRVAVIFPFEIEAYQSTSLPVEFVGHPLTEALRTCADASDPGVARAQLEISGDDPLVALFPGSRRNEIDRHLPVQLDACAKLHAKSPALRFAVAVAPSVSAEQVEACIRAQNLPASIHVKVVSGQSRDVMRACHVAIAKPGTVTLELAMLARPMVVVGKVDPLTAWVLRRSVRVPYYAMPNLVAGRLIVPEVLQEDATGPAVAAAVFEIMDGEAREQQLKNLAEVGQVLGTQGAAKRASEIAREMLGHASH
jgi:lipid-A-disaccharide synthase